MTETVVEPAVTPGPRKSTHPRGLMTLFFTEMWERFSFYGMKAMLFLFVTAAVMDGGLGITESAAVAPSLSMAARTMGTAPATTPASNMVRSISDIFRLRVCR